MNTKLILFSIVVIVQSHFCNGQISYKSHEEIIANPERGFYHHTEVQSTNYENLNLETLLGWRTNESITQILRVFYLQQFRETPISEHYLNNIRKDFLTARKAGIKCIVRFAYSTGTTAPYNDATPEIVQMHINQLRPVLRENADVIAVMQAGFVGTWGEWYFTDHFAQNPGYITDEDWENRRQVVYSLLDALPSDRYVQIRTPGYKFKIFDSKEPLNEETAFLGDYQSRLGHHNDCFVASSSDFGTYVDPDVEKPFLAVDTYFTPMGGETCNVAPPYSDCDNSLSDLESYHWSYLNIDYNKQVLNEWSNQGCFDEVELSLGYRFELNSGDFSENTKPGGIFNFSLNLQNVGYSNPYNPRMLEVILKNKETQEEYYFSPQENIKLWPIKTAFDIEFSSGLPSDISEGNYDLYLNMPDPYPSLYDNPHYSIRMANDGVWVDSLGYNLLAIDISISNSNTAEDYTGENEFVKKSISQTLEIEGSNKIYGGAGNDKILVYWGRQSSEYTRVIERTSNEGPFQIIASIPADLDYYLDTDISNETTFKYRYYLTKSGAKTATSDEIELTLETSSYPTISVDGDLQDWNDVPPAATSVSGSDIYSIRLHFDAQKMNLGLEGPIIDYEIYLDTDNSTSTGSTEEPQGMDVRLKDGTFQVFESTWVSSDAIVGVEGTNPIELSISLSDIPNLDNNKVFRVFGKINSGSTLLSDQDQTPSTHYRNLPPDLPKNLNARKSGSIPQTRLVITWDACENCLGYELERSLDGENFEPIGTHDFSTTLITDDNLTNETTYYYRIAAFNNIGITEFSEAVSESTGEPEPTLNTLSSKGLIYPNPVHDHLHISDTWYDVEIFNVGGQLLLKSKGKTSIDMSSAQKGLYLVHLQRGDEKRVIKLIKQ
ncbi:MAG: DUF4832 domain-containing protein [Cyclobacteriaceae bacterium]